MLFLFSINYRNARLPFRRLPLFYSFSFFLTIDVVPKIKGEFCTSYKVFDI